MSAVLISAGVIFAAELGDKSQLMALTFATRYRASTVLFAIAASTSVAQLLSVSVGAAVGAALPERAVAIAGGITFLAFAVWSLLDDDEEDDGNDNGGDGGDADQPTQAATGRSILVTIALAFFLAEFGDKTMLATVALAADHGPVGTWIGATLGMVACGALAIVVGKHLGDRLPQRSIRYGSAAAFALFGVLLITNALAVRFAH